MPHSDGYYSFKVYFNKVSDGDLVARLRRLPAHHRNALVREAIANFVKTQTVPEPSFGSGEGDANGFVDLSGIFPK
jgi:hypothetical protein